MKCPVCKTEMLVDRVLQEGNTEKFFYKCPNPACKNFGYKKTDDRKEVMKNERN